MFLLITRKLTSPKTPPPTCTLFKCFGSVCAKVCRPRHMNMSVKHRWALETEGWCKTWVLATEDPSWGSFFLLANWKDLKTSAPAVNLHNPRYFLLEKCNISDNHGTLITRNTASNRSRFNQDFGSHKLRAWPCWLTHK